MRSPTFLHGVAVAFVLSFFASALFTAMTFIIGPEPVLRLLIPVLGFGYVLYLLGRSGERTGRVITIIVWILVAAGTFFIAPPLALYLIVHVGLVWLIRSLYFYSSSLAALIDLALSAASLAVAVWAATWSGSVFLTVWCFFLMQALFASIPRTFPRGARKESGASPYRDEEPFERAHRMAEAAVRRLSLNS